jgi:CRP/FNR family transcriptional regulator, anaerobic regulatory protein
LITDSRQIASITQQFGFLQEADADFRDAFFKHATPASIDLAQPICDQGMQCSHLALVTQGSARVYKLGENGREITLYRVGPGESCILTASCIISGKPFPAFAVCETPIDALVIHTGEVMRWTNDYPVWRNFLFGLISARLGDVISIVEEIAFRRVDRRLASYLLHRATDQTGMGIRITHQAIASDLGTSREVVSRILKDFEHQGLIAIARGQISLSDPQGLTVKSVEN